MSCARPARPILLALALTLPSLLPANPGAAGDKAVPDRDAATAAALEKVRAWREAHESAILDEFRSLLSIPNTAGDDAALRANAAALEAMLKRRGITAELFESAGSPPAVFGWWPARDASATIILYAHYDGQPVVARDWSGDPWTAALRRAPDPLRPFAEAPWPAAGVRPDPEARLRARGASDDKGTIIAMMAAVDAIRAAGLERSVNVKFFFEGEEEAGSPHLGEMLRRHGKRLKADGLFLCDGPVHQARRPLLLFGARGMAEVEMTALGPSRPLHSGHYGNWAPNPAALLAGALARLRDTDGRVLVPGFYDDVRAPSAAEREAVARAPRIDDELRAAFGIAAAEGGAARLEDRILLPAMNVRGLRSGGVGAEAQNAIPTEASASVDFRLVPDQDPARVRALVEAALRGMGFSLVGAETDDAVARRSPRPLRLRWGPGYPAGRAPMDGRFARAAIRALRAAAGDALVTLPTSGGSIPVSVFQRALGCPVALLPIANHDNNQHGADENLRLRNLWDGVQLHAALFLGFRD